MKPPGEAERPREHSDGSISAAGIEAVSDDGNVVQHCLRPCVRIRFCSQPINRAGHSSLRTSRKVRPVVKIPSPSTMLIAFRLPPFTPSKRQFRMTMARLWRSRPASFPLPT